MIYLVNTFFSIINKLQIVSMRVRSLTLVKHIFMDSAHPGLIDGDYALLYRFVKY